MMYVQHIAAGRTKQKLLSSEITKVINFVSPDFLRWKGNFTRVYVNDPTEQHILNFCSPRCHFVDRQTRQTRQAGRQAEGDLETYGLQTNTHTYKHNIYIIYIFVMYVVYNAHSNNFHIYYTKAKQSCMLIS